MRDAFLNSTNAIIGFSGSETSAAHHQTVAEAFLALFAKPYLLVKIVDYRWGEILRVFWNCLKVTLVAIPIPLLFYFLLGVSNLWYCAVILVVSIISVLVSVWTLGLTKDMRTQVIQAAKARLSKQ